MADLIPAWVDGTLTPVEKLAVHQRGLRHPAVSVFVLQADRLLLQRRALGKYHTPGLWANSCCTHPHWGEDPGVCATRRLHQELGLAGLVLSHRGQVEYRADVGRGLTEHELVDVFLASAAAPLIPVPDPAEVSETRWMTLPDLLADLAANPAIYTPWLHVYIRDHADWIFPPAP